MYYMLECFGAGEEERQAIDIVPTDISWNRGLPLRNEPSDPLEVTMDGDGVMVAMFNRGILLWRDDLIAAIKGSGVNNIDCYDAVLIDPVANVRYTNYKAINIVGVVAAADLDHSKYSMPSGRPVIDADFESVVIDSDKANGNLLFRMAECVSAIVIHERVKNAIEKTGIIYLDFVQPENWFG